MSANLVILSGCLTRDPDVRIVGAASSTVATSSIAVNSSFKKKDGNWSDDVAFIPIELWGQSAEEFGKSCLKGDRVLVRGELRQERWEDKEGKKRELLKIKVWEFGKLAKTNNNKSVSQSKFVAVAESESESESESEPKPESYVPMPNEYEIPF